jgi:hypothetical protein
MFYGVTQHANNVEHRWIFTKAEILQQLGSRNIQILRSSQKFRKTDFLDGAEVELGWPIPGDSFDNVFETKFELLEGSLGMRGFLERKSEGLWLDPYIQYLKDFKVVVETETPGCCTQVCLDRLGYKASELIQTDDQFGRCARASEMLKLLYPDEPESSVPDMTFSQLEEVFSRRSGL